MIESGQLTNEEIRMFAGHEDFSATAKFYNYSTVSWDKRTDAFYLTGSCSYSFKTIDIPFWQIISIFPSIILYASPKSLVTPSSIVI